MSNDEGDPIALFAVALTPLMRPFQRRPQQPQPLPPYRQQIPATPEQKTLRRAWCGAGFLTACLWLSPVVWRDLAGPFLQSPHGTAAEIWLPLALWTFVTLAALVALLVGLREARARVAESFMGAFWAASLLLGIGVLFVKQLYPDDATAGYAVRGLYITAAAVAAVHLWIASGLAAARAERVAQRKLKQQNAPMRPARSRRRVFFRF